MAVNPDLIGRTYAPSTYAVGREKVIEFALAVGESNPLHLDPGAARQAGHADVVAPPMFVVVFAGRAVTPALFDSELGIDFAHMVHGGQEFRWGPMVVAGDEIITTATVAGVSERGGMGFFVFETVSVNQREETVASGVWTNIVRGAEPAR
jgi:acyl dehydratase